MAKVVKVLPPGWRDWTMESGMPDLSGVRILVTGANAGHGKAAVKALLNHSNAEKIILAWPLGGAGQGCDGRNHGSASESEGANGGE